VNEPTAALMESSMMAGLVIGGLRVLPTHAFGIKDGWSVRDYIKTSLKRSQRHVTINMRNE